MGSPIVDVTSLYGVESLFRKGTRDPWGQKLAGRLADFFIFSDQARFTMPVRAEAAPPDDTSLPPILAQLRSRDPGVLAPLPYVVDEERRLKDVYLEPAFHAFATWAANNKSAIKRWLRLHDEIRLTPGEFFRPRSVFDTASLAHSESFHRLGASLGVSRHDLIYAFDNVLRSPHDGE